MSGDDKRRSDRVVPMVSDEEMVVIESGGQRFLAKLMDLSGSGTLVYLVSEPPKEGSGDFRLSFYHQGRVFSVAATLTRANGHLIAFRFKDPTAGFKADLEVKLIRMEVEWARLRDLI